MCEQTEIETDSVYCAGVTLNVGRIYVGSI